jgi:hypothetical protein
MGGLAAGVLCAGVVDDRVRGAVGIGDQDPVGGVEGLVVEQLGTGRGGGERGDGGVRVRGRVIAWLRFSADSERTMLPLASCSVVAICQALLPYEAVLTPRPAVSR